MFSANTTQVSSGGYQISRSLRFNIPDSTTLTRTAASASNRKTWTWSGWVKPSEFGGRRALFSCFFASNDTSTFIVEFDASNELAIGLYTLYALQTTQVFRDPAAWYHIVVAVDTTQATVNNRIKLYVNGVQITAFATNNLSSIVPQNTDLAVNSANTHYIGGVASVGFFNAGYMTEVNFIDGQQLDASSFGQTDTQTGVWGPKAYSGSYGTNGFYVNFSDNSNTTAATLGKDYSGNGNNWTPNNFSVSAGAGNDSLVDTPTAYGVDTGVGGEVRGNYSTWNPLSVVNSTFANGNLDATVTTASSPQSENAASTFAVNSGKWYCEIVSTGGSGPFIGIADASLQAANRTFNSSSVWCYFSVNGQKYNAGSGTAYGSTWTTNDVIGIALDMDAGTVTFYKNGTSQGVAFSGLTGRSIVIFLTTGSGSPGNICTYTGNFGQRPFAYTAPSGYKALCTQNLPTPTIGATTATQAGKFFNPVLYAGNGGTQSVTGVGFQPDFVWVKNRSAANGHGFEDVLRGAGYTLASDSTSAEINYSNYFTAFTSDGFNMALGGGTFNNGTSNYVAWNWKANGSGVTNTAGSVTSTVSANTTSGFSVVKWTQPASGTYTIGHGLGSAPAMILMKSTTLTSNWAVYHQSIGYTQYGRLNTFDAFIADSSVWVAAPTSSVFSQLVNYGTGGTSVAYCFAEVAGYSKFGSYTGNGSADGTFVYTGFRPAYVMIKGKNIASSWLVFDDKRSAFNLTSKMLVPNSSDAEYDTPSSWSLDFVSNGFKIRSTDAQINNNGDTYIFAAFATAPFKFSLAR